jgi:hypothetical protein
MEMNKRWMLVLAAACGLAILPVVAGAQETTKKSAKAKSAKATVSSSDAKLPEAVRKTFDNKFPNAKIEQATEEKEGGTMVWDIEFRVGKKHSETDIAQDGTMLELSEQVTPKSVPKAAMSAIRKAAEGGKVNHTDKVTLSYEIKDDKIVKLDKPRTQYEANVTKGEQSSDIIVDGDGKMIEEPKWEAAKSEKASAEKSEGEKPKARKKKV